MPKELPKIQSGLKQWYYYPEMLPGGKFRGYQTDMEITQGRGYFPIGQNMAFDEEDVPTLRAGYELIEAAEVSDAYPVTRAHIFETRNGVKWELKAYNTGVYAFLIGNSSAWTLLKGGFTANKKFSFANIGQTDQIASWCFFCNGTENPYRWTGAYGLVASSTVSSITKEGTTTWAEEGFYAPYSPIGISTTSWNITKAGDTVRYTYNGTGGNPDLTPGKIPVGTQVVISCANFAVANRGTFTITAQDTNYFEVTNANGTAESNKTQGADNTILYDANYQNWDTGQNKVIIDGVEYNYTGGANTTTLTGLSADVSALAAGAIVIHSPVELTGTTGGGADSTKFSVSMAHDGRLHVRRENKKSVWDYSKLDDPDDFGGTGTNDGDGDAKDIEFSGPITAFGKLNKVALCLKKRVIKSLAFNQVGARIDSPVYSTLVSVDDKSTTLGAMNDKSTFSTPYGLVFVTPDKKMVLLTGITQNNEPQYLFLSKPVQSIFDKGVHDEASGICVNNKIYYSFKQDENSAANDTVIIGDLEAKTTDQDGNIVPIRWDAPTVGWNVNDWTAVESVDGKKIEVHWHSSLNSNSYRIVEDKVDSGVSFTHTLRTWNEHFDAPLLKKNIDLAYLELDMLENTQLTVTLLYDIDGNSGRTEYVVSGTDLAHQRQGATYNVFGASAFGSQKIGSNPQQSEMKRYIYYLDVNPNISFFTISLQISGEQENNDFRLIRFGYRLNKVISEPDKVLLHNTN